MNYTNEDLDDYAYDVYVDRIICSKDFEECKYKNIDSDCLLVEPHRRCWFVSVCPDGKERR